jgi:hypothetical protein
MTGAARLDFPRKIGQFLLILARPGAHALQHGVDLFLVHAAKITRRRSKTIG